MFYVDNTSVSSGGDDSEHEQDTDDNGQNENAKWADSIAKILKTNKPKGKKTLVLSKGKKLTNVKKKPQKLEFEVEGADGEIKREVAVEENVDEEETEAHERRKVILYLFVNFFFVYFEFSLAKRFAYFTKEAKHIT